MTRCVRYCYDSLGAVEKSGRVFYGRGKGYCLFCRASGNRLDVIVTNLMLSCLPAVDVAAAADAGM